MIISNFKRFTSLMLLASVATPVVAAPAPVTDLNAPSTSSVSNSAPSVDIERLERLIRSRGQLQLQLQRQLDVLADEISGIRGMVERNGYELDQMLERQRQLYIEIDTLRSAKPVAPTEIVEKPTNNASGSYSADTDENQAYQNAVDLILKQKDYVGATSAFNQFIATYPNSVYSDNAHYWLGQLYFVEKNDIEAAKNFAKVTSYPKSTKRSDALLKLGEIAKRNNNKSAASKYYQQVISEYPDSTTAKTAESQLKSL